MEHQKQICLPNWNNWTPGQNLQNIDIGQHERSEVVSEIWKTSDMTPTIALAYYLESVHAETWGSKKSPAVSATWGDGAGRLGRPSVKIHRAKCCRGECYIVEELKRYEDVPHMASAGNWWLEVCAGKHLFEARERTTQRTKVDSFTTHIGFPISSKGMLHNSWGMGRVLRKVLPW